MKFILKTDEHFILHKGESVINVDEVISEVGGKADASDLSTVAISGSYNDLIDKPTQLPASDVYSWAKASTKPSYTLDEVTDGSTRKLSDYLKKEDISAWAKASTKPTYTPSEIGLGNVGNFKAVSTVASQGLTSTEQANARANIGAGTSSLTLGNGSSNAYYGDKGKIAYDHSQTLHARTDATKVEASSTNGNIKINGTETTVYTHPSGTNPHGTTKSDVGLGNVTNDSQVKRTEMGTANGVATLGSDGKVLSSQLPSYVDDVVDLLNIVSSAPSTCAVGDKYYNTSSNKIFTATATNTWETIGTIPESGKIYINITNGKTYRWSGTTLGVISETLALGETSSTAYRGDRGKIAYDHSQTTHARTDATKVEASSTNGNIKINGTETKVYTHPSGTNPHGTTKSDVGLGNVGNFKAVSTVASQGLTDTEKSNARANIGAGTSSFSGSYNDLSNKPTLFSGSYNDLTNKPTIPAAANNGTFSIKTKVGSNTAVVASDFTANQSSADDITFIQGSNVTLTTDATNRTITISSTNTTYSAATTSAAGLMSAADKTKLDGIATGATAVSSSTVSGWGFTKNAGTVTQVKVGTTAYDPSSGIVSLPAYPTTLPASDVYSWAKASSKPSYAWTEITGKPSTFTPATHEHSYITALANYAFTSSTLPNSFNLGISAGFVAQNSGFGNYGSVLNVITYSGGGGSFQLYAPYSPTYGGTHLKARFGNYDSSNGNSWTTLKELAWVGDIPTKVSQLTNDSGYTTNTGTVTQVTAGTGLTGTVTTSGSIGINSTYQTYISNGNTAYGWGNHANAGYVKSVKVGTTSYSPSSGVISLPAYPTSLPASNTTSTYSSTGTVPVNGTAVASALSNYIPKSGGTMNSDASLIIGDSSSPATQQQLTISKSGLSYHHGMAYFQGTEPVGEVFKNGGGIVPYGNSSGQIPISNGTLCENLNADKLDGYDADDFLRDDDGSIYTHTNDPSIFNNAGDCILSYGMDNSLIYIGESSIKCTSIESEKTVISGKLGVGTQATYPLDVSGNAKFSGCIAVNGSIPNSTYGLLANNSCICAKNANSCYAEINCQSTSTTGTMVVAFAGGSNQLSMGSYGSGGVQANYYITSQSSTKRHHFSQPVKVDGSCTADSHPTSSDERLKDVVDENAAPSIDDIANAPAVHFQWKNEEVEEGQWKETHVGTIAQYWQEIMPECVHQDGEYLTMQYDTIALLAAISLARKNKELEQRIISLENQLQELKS